MKMNQSPTASLAVAVSIFWFRPQDIAPAARGTDFESASDGVMALDSQNSFMNADPLIQQFTGYPLLFLVGQCKNEVFLRKIN